MNKENRETHQKNIKLIQILQQLIKDQNNISRFNAFLYDSEFKTGYFKFEGYPLTFSFHLQPMIGMNEVYIAHYSEGNPKIASIKEEANKILGEEFTEKINAWIKEKLKLRFLF